METLKIQIQKGFEIDTFNKATGEIKFKEKSKDVLERILTDEDVLADNGYTLDSFNLACSDLEEHEKAFRFLNLLAKSLNQGWKPDFDNSSQYKYQPYFLGGSSGFRCGGCGAWYSASAVGSRLCFKESRLAIHAGEKFTKWYKEIIVIK
jgi:hypothetical protein